MPGNWESRGLPGLRRRRLVHAHGRVAAGATGACEPDARPRRQHVGSVGQRPVGVAAARRRPRRRAAGGGRGFLPPTYDLPPGTLRPGRTRSPCAFRTTATTADSSARRTRCSWRPAATSCRSPARGSTASSGRPTPARSTRSRASWRARRVHRERRRGRRRAAAARRRGAGRRPAARRLPGQMKFDLDELTVAPGSSSRSCSSTPTRCSTTSCSGTPGSLERSARRPTSSRSRPTRLAQQYVPEIPQVLVCDEARRSRADARRSSSGRRPRRDSIRTSARSPATGG